MNKKNIIIIKNSPKNTRKNDFDFLKCLVKFNIKFNCYKKTFFIEILENNFNMKNIKKTIKRKISEKIEISVLSNEKLPLELNKSSKILLVIFENLNAFNVNFEFIRKIVFLIKKPKKLVFFKKNDSFQALLEFSCIDKSKIVKKNIPLIFKLLNIFISVYYTKKAKIDIRKGKPNEIEFNDSKELPNSNKSLQDIKTQNDEYFIDFDINIFNNLLFGKNLTKIVYLKFNSKIDKRKLYDHFKSYGKIEKIKYTKFKAVIYFKHFINFKKLNKWNFKIKKPKLYLDYIHDYYLLFENIEEYYHRLNIDLNEKILEEMKRKIKEKKNKIAISIIWKDLLFNASNVLVLEIMKNIDKLKLFNYFKKSIESKEFIIDFFERISSDKYLIVFKKEIHVQLILKKFNKTKDVKFYKVDPSII